MAMLAERKRKVKWSLNPRGKAWSQDSNKFGQKMLEKMGWQQGKGLGPDGKGITEHIRTTYKNDSKGMGYKQSDEQWTEHEDNFASLLESLSAGAAKPDEVKLKSLEKKSESSKARVHYQKFTRGKDLSRYSEKDLANIFGKKTLKESKTEKQEDKSDTNGNVHKYDSDLLLNAGSMRDYFNKKLSNFGKTNGYVIGKNGVLKKEESESESEARPSFGFGYKSNGVMSDELNNLPSSGDGKNKSEQTAKATFVSYLDVEEIDCDKKKNKKKRKGDCDEHSVLSPKKSKKNDEETSKKKLKAKVEENMGLSNPAFNPLPTPVKVQRHTLNTIQESISENSDLEENSPKTLEIQAEVYVNAPKDKYESEKQKKKKKSRNNDEVSEICNSEEKKSKKKKKISNGFENDIIVENIENTPMKKQVNYSIETETEENPYEVKINKKKRKNKQVAVDNPNFNDTTYESINTSQTEENPYEVKIKEKKKKKQEKHFAVENPNFNTTLESSINDSQFEASPYEVKVKKKKDKKLKEDRFAPSSSSFDGTTVTTTDSSKVETDANPDEAKIKEKKKKKKKEQFALENPNFNATENSIDESQIEVNPYEVKVKKKKVKGGKFVLNSYDGTVDNSTDSSQVEIKENSYEIKIKEKKKKKREDQFALDNPNFNATLENSIDSHCEVNPYEVKVKEKKKKKVKDDDSAENSINSSQVKNPYEVKVENKSKRKKQEMESLTNSVQVNEIKDKKRKKKEAFAIDNPHFDPNDSLEVDIKNNTLEVERKKKKQKKAKKDRGIVNPALHLDNSQSEGNEVVSDEIDESDIMLNVVTTPVVTKSTPRNEGNTYSITKVDSVKRTKSVRFSDVTQERIIPNNDELREIEDESEKFSTQVTNGYSESHTNGIDTSSLTNDENRSKRGKKRKLGLDNAAFDKRKNTLEENLDSISKTIDTYQAEIENDINEKKLETFQMDDMMVGEVGNPHGENEKLADGSMLRFKYANFKGQTPFYIRNKTGSKKSYKHLIKGDIVVKFKNSNLHEINGYAAKA